MRERLSYLAVVLLILLCAPSGVVLLFSDKEKIQIQKSRIWKITWLESYILRFRKKIFQRKR